MLKDESNQIVANWPFDKLLSLFHRKIRHLILVTARTKTVNDREHFHYHRAVFYSGWMLKWHVPKIFREAIINLDIRMHLKNERVRNHGTAFRILEHDLPKLYPYGEELPL